ncbi:MAG: hypothetical protein GY757_34020 [bacterium]|nr:hypothetical protein [bacterium]
MKLLILDLTDNHDIKILSARVTTSINISSGYYMTLADGDDAIETAAQKIRDEKLADYPLYIIPSRDFVKSHTFHFPPMPDKELDKILPREIAATTDSTDPVIYNYLKNGSVIEKGVEKIEIAAFFVMKDQIINFLDRLKALGLNPARIIPEVQGLKTLVEAGNGFSTERTGVVFMDLMDGRVSLNIFKDKYWGLGREFAFQFQQGGDISEDDLSRISVELNRTFQYFKQRNRRYTIDKAVLYGANSNIEHLKLFISDNLPVNAETILPEHFGLKISFPSGLKDKQEFTSFFTMALATAAAISKKDFLNLYPEEFKEKEKMPRRLVGLAISVAIIATILIGSTLWFEKVKNSYQQDINGIKKTFLSLSKNAAQINSTKHQRANFYKKRFFADIPIRFSYGAANFIRRISLLVTPEVELGKLKVKPRAQDFTFTLTGSIKAPDNISAQAQFLRFYKQLKNMDEMEQITFSTIKVEAGKVNRSAMQTTAGLETKEDNKNEDVALNFTINGDIELE